MYGEYDRVLPGSADRILTMAEKEQAHRVSMEGIALRASAKDSKLGQYFGFSLALLASEAASILRLKARQLLRLR